MEALIALEQPLIKVPLEQLRKAGRNELKYCDKELTNALQMIQDVAKKHATGQLTADKAASTLNALGNRLKQLLRKVQQEAAQQSEARIHHLERLSCIDSALSDDWKAWNQDNLNVLLADYMLRMGQMETAKKLAQEAQVVDLIDFGLFTKAKKIADALEATSCKDCLAWCADNRSALVKCKSLLEFELLVQEYIQLVASGNTLDAIHYARQYLAPNLVQTGDVSPSDAQDMMDVKRKQLQRVMALAACPPHTTNVRYAAYFSPNRWVYLKELFLSNFAEISGLFPQPLLIAALRAGLSALKTSSCNVDDGHSSKNMHCPVCVKPLCELAQDVPRAHHVHSTILCSVSTMVIGGEEVAGVGPNGNVYAYRVFEEGAKRNNGLFVDPRTGESFPLKQVMKLYIT